MTQPESLKISVDSLMNETKRISQFLISKHTSLIFFHNMLQADIDYESYCSLYDSIKKYAGTIPLNADTKIIKEKLMNFLSSQRKILYTALSACLLLYSFLYYHSA